MLKKIAIVIVIAVLAVLGLVATQPDSYSVTRTIAIKAPPEKIMPLISDFHNWPQWSPWEKLDPNLKRTFSGAPQDLGAVYAWEGNKDVGSGRMQITSLTPLSKVGIKLEFFTPMASLAQTDFVLQQQGDMTNVTWTMSGKSGFATRLMTVFTSLDKMIGPDFEKGLAQLKAVAEK